MKTQRIVIFPLDEIDSFLLKRIGSSLQRAFRYSYQVLPWEDIGSQVPGLLRDGKYNSTAVLLYIAKKMPANSQKILAVAQADLYSPIFAYLYGEAQMRGPAAVMSLHRLRPEFYRQPPDREVFLSRCEKEALHEVGHTFGLVHCRDKNCVMHPSSTVMDTDIKSLAFCPVCKVLLG